MNQYWGPDDGDPIREQAVGFWVWMLVVTVNLALTLTAFGILVAIFWSLAAGAAESIKPGVERWSVKTSLPAGTDLSTSTFVDIKVLETLPDVIGVKKDDARFRDMRMPNSIEAGDLYLHEGDLVRTDAWLHLVAFEEDGDLHVQINESPTNKDQCFIVEVPNPDPRFEKNATLQKVLPDVRSAIDKLFKKKLSPGSVRMLAKPVHVMVTGALFYDDAHVGTPSRGKKGMLATSLWEIHPVTKIEVIP